MVHDNSEKQKMQRTTKIIIDISYINLGDIFYKNPTKMMS